MLLQACCIWAIIVPVLHAKKLAAERDELCETLPSEIHIIKASKAGVNRHCFDCLSYYIETYTDVEPSSLDTSVDPHIRMEDGRRSEQWPLTRPRTYRGDYSEEFDELGRLQRTCNGEIAVNKCEGACNSQVQPSVITPTGFLKECYCCRESFLRERVITLSHCYDPDGIRITTEEHKSMDIKLKEPNECKCFKCGDFSR